MEYREISEDQKKAFDAVVHHPLQSYEWGEFRKQSGLKVIRRGLYDKTQLIAGFQMTIHPLGAGYSVGYMPKGENPNKYLIAELKKIGQTEKCIFIQLEPNVIRKIHYAKEQNESPILANDNLQTLGLQPAAHPLFTKYTFQLDLTKTEEELLKNMHQKARYNIRVAQRHGVEVVEDNSDEAFEFYWKLMDETTKRQKFYAHTRKYHRQQWDIINVSKNPHNALQSHLFLAKYNGKPLTAWLLFRFKDQLFYPYGASSSEHREVMHSNLMMWEVIKYGQKQKLKTFDMWGAMGPEPDTKDPWYGFHNFKQKYGPDLVEFIGSYDLVLNPPLYQLFKVADKLRWMLLKLKK